MSDRTRTTLLLSVLGVIALVVVFDTLRKGGDGTPSTETASTFQQRAQDLERQRDLVGSESAWTEALARSSQAWERVRSRSVEAATPELAAADFRALLVDTARTFNLEVSSADRLTSRPLEGVPAGMDPVHELEVRLRVTSHDVRALQRFIDAVEHLPSTTTHIATLSLDGPGLAQRVESASATLTVRALGVTPAPEGGDA